MVRRSLDEELLGAIRNAQNRRLTELEKLVGSPRTNFGRPLTKGLRAALRRLVDEGVVEEDGGAYRLSEGGRRSLAANVGSTAEERRGLIAHEPDEVVDGDVHVEDVETERRILEPLEEGGAGASAG